MRYLAILAVLSGACVADPLSPTMEPIAYSTSDDLRGVVEQAIAILNVEAGCELTVLEPAGEHITPIRGELEHGYGANYLGCAYVGSALYPDASALPVVIVEGVLNMSERGASVLIVHEMLHTLGLDYTENAGFLASGWREDGDFFDASTTAHLRRLCDMQ